jgi:ADP-ribose pyrophosphatase YjhB (NUDIX family)
MSPQRIDYYDSPEAPRANSLVPAVNVVVVNDAGEILLIRRTDNGSWALPGGAIDLGESVAQAAVRETLEESGIECAITGLVGIYSDPRHVILYTSNGEARQEFSIVLTARPLSGQPTPSSEASAALGRGIRPLRLQDGSVDAHPHQRLLGTKRDTSDHLIPLTGGQRRSSRAASHGAQQHPHRPLPRGERAGK